MKLWIFMIIIKEIKNKFMMIFIIKIKFHNKQIIKKV